MPTELVSYALEGSTAVLRMDDGKANALSDAMIDALGAALDRAEAEARAVVVIGRPERFCAGFDLKAMLASPDSATALLTRGSALLLRLYLFPLPLVHAVTGHALAGGALLALTGDWRVGAHGAFRVGLNEVAIGMPVPVLAVEFARDRLTAAELPSATLMSKIYDPAGAVAAGYLDEAVPAEQVAARAVEVAGRLAALSPVAYRATKERLRGQVAAHIRDTLAADIASMGELLRKSPPGR